MPALRFADERVPEPLRPGLARLRAGLGVATDFPPEVLAEAAAAASAVLLPDADRTDLPFVTIDPPGARDLDQALHLERTASGYLVRYAIADVAAFVAPGGAIDAEAHRRGETLYAPSLRTPLHPPALSEGAASLLPGQVRPALLWEIELDAAGAPLSATVSRARVRSRAQHTYDDVQAALDAGTAAEVFVLLREVGLLRQAAERARGGVSLQAPEQEIRADGDRWTLEYRRALPVEDWNAQISLLTGFAAAKLMLDAGVGILRTLPPAAPEAVDRLRAVASGLGLSWPAGTSYADFVRGLDPATGAGAAMMTACTRLFAGAGYAAFDGTPPAQPMHGALAAPYAHCTAPLRRLVDRYSGEVCLAICAGNPVPEWALAALPGLPATMEASDTRAKKYERGIVDLTEALVLSPRVGETFVGMVIQADPRGAGGVVLIADPAVEAKASGSLRLGEETRVRLESVDLVAGVVRFVAV